MWYQEVNAGNGHVSRPLGQQKAVDFLPPLGMISFKQVYAGRTNIRHVMELFQKLSVVKKQNKTLFQWRKWVACIQEGEKIASYSLTDVWNTDEMFYELLPHILHAQGGLCKRSKQRLMIALFCRTHLGQRRWDCLSLASRFTCSASEMIICSPVNTKPVHIPEGWEIYLMNGKCRQENERSKTQYPPADRQSVALPTTHSYA